MTATAVSVTGLGKTFGASTAVDDLNLEVPAGTFTALLGPSGCGKSTTLSMLAGLLDPDTGDIRFDGQSVLATPAERRPVGLVFQKPLLFPHLSVAQNVAFGLRMRRLGRARTRQQVGQMLERVQLSPFADRRVGQLSGGQEQRVALARALVLEPKVLLLDEPFSQLDSALRSEMRALLRQLHDESEVSTLFVTHDQSEAVEVADTITLMLQGRVAGQGSPELFYTRPPSLAAARFFAVTNEITGQVCAGQFTAASARIAMPAGLADGPAVLVIRPEAVELSDTVGTVGTDTITGTAVAAQFAGSHIIVDIDPGHGQRLRAHQPVGRAIDLGQTVHARLPRQACTVFSVKPS